MNVKLKFKIANVPYRDPMVDAGTRTVVTNLPYKPGTISKASVSNLLAVIDKGLADGMGDPKPGEMCIEAAVSFALGYMFGDRPECVHPNLARFKIHLNDRWPWKDNAARARGLRRLGVAQLGTKGQKHFNYARFWKLLSRRWQIRINSYPLLAVSDVELRQVAGWIKKRDFALLRGWYESLGELNAFEGITPNDLTQMFPNYDDDKEQAAMGVFVEDAVQVLKSMKTPGSKFLYLTEGGYKIKPSYAKK